MQGASSRFYVIGRMKDPSRSLTITGGPGRSSKFFVKSRNRRSGFPPITPDKKIVSNCGSQQSNSRRPVARIAVRED